MGRSVYVEQMGCGFPLLRQLYYQSQDGRIDAFVLLDESLAKLAKPGLQTWQPLVLQRFDKENAETVAFIRSYKKLKNKVREDVFEYMWPKNTPKQGAKVFEENEEIHQQILDGTLTAADLQYIIDQM